MTAVPGLQLNDCDLAFGEFIGGGIMSRMRCPLPVVMAVLALSTFSPAYGAAAEPSTEAANTLVSLMKTRSLDAVAVQDPQAPDRFIAAMLVPGVQLLVVS